MISEFIEEENIPSTQRPCENCGASQFYAEAGFYYCSVCNTQSQSHRVYVDEDFIPERQITTRAAVLRDARESTKKGTGQPKTFVSTWEIWNCVLKKIADGLVEIGFPEVVRNKILHLYSAFMVRRKVIFVSKTNAAAKSKISLGEPKRNIRSFYGLKTLPKPNRIPRQARKRKIMADNADEEHQNIHGRLNPEDLATRAQRKKKIAITRKKAMEQDYLVSRDAKEAQEDAEFEKAMNVEQTSKKSNDGKDAEKPSIIHFTKASRILKNKCLKGVPIKGIIKNLGVSRLKNLRKTQNDYALASLMLHYEHFSTITCVVLVFVALRQLGFPIVFTDLLRLFRCGVFDLDKFQDEMKTYDEYKNVHSFGKSVYVRLERIDPIKITKSIEDFNKYMGITKFFAPQMKEIVPKYIDDFVLPREFECVVNLFNHMFSFEDLAVASGIIRLDRLRYAPELVVISQIVAVLKMLFGLDDVTEKYQSKFAQLVNKVIKEEANKQGYEMDDWTELFVIEDWFAYIQRRRDLVKRELYCNGIFTPNRPPSLVKLNNMMKTKCTLNDEDDKKDLTESQKNADSWSNVFKQVLNDQLPVTDGIKQYSDIPVLKPYVPLPLPTQSIVNQYLERYPLVGDPSFKPELFKCDFVKKRIDFIWNPKKYAKLLELSGYEVEIVRGNAVDNFPTDLEEGTVLVFQPYKSYDEVIADAREECSSSMNLLLGVCEDIVPFMRTRTYQQGTLDTFARAAQTLGKLYIEKVLLGHVPILTRWYDEY